MGLIRKRPQVHFQLASKVNENPELKHQINRIASLVFGHGENYSNDLVSDTTNKNGIVAYIMLNETKVVSVGFGNPTEESYWLHTFGTLEEYRGQGFCTEIIKKFVKKIGNKHVLYLTVRTEPGQENYGAIKCYKKNGFIMLPEVYRDHYDGRNNAMVLVPEQSAARNKRQRTRQKKRGTKI